VPKAKRPPAKKTRPSTYKPKPATCLEERFVLLWYEVAKDTRFSTLEAEVQIPPRRFRWDFRIMGTNILVEVNGGTYHSKRLGHSSAAGIMRDYEKSNYAQMKGWQQFTYDTKQVNLTNVQELFTYVCRKYPHLL
jgi:very-short-patch-repair endonuclease